MTSITDQHRIRKPSRSRWSDNDRYLGPFTYAHDPRYRYFGVVLGSGDGDEHPGCTIRVGAFGHTLISALPALIKPSQRKVIPNWDAATIARLGRDFYWDYTTREYGFSYGEGFLNIMFGRQSHDSRTEQRKGYFLPWTQWRFVRHSLYDLRGEHVWTEDDGKDWDASHKAKVACPAATFAFTDFDGEQLTAQTIIEEREWLFGDGSFKWLSWFRKPKVHRSLDISFSKGTGRRKGSWKGGTMGHSIDLLPDELHEAAFRRYCAEHEMTFGSASKQALPLSANSKTIQQLVERGRTDA